MGRGPGSKRAMAPCPNITQIGKLCAWYSLNSHLLAPWSKCATCEVCFAVHGGRGGAGSKRAIAPCPNVIQLKLPCVRHQKTCKHFLIRSTHISRPTWSKGAKVNCGLPCKSTHAGSYIRFVVARIELGQHSEIVSASPVRTWQSPTGLCKVNTELAETSRLC